MISLTLKTIDTVMEMLNQVHVRGIVGNARVQKIGDTELVRFSVATDHAYTNRHGEKVVEVTCYSNR